jgi:hypothetical protein
MHQHPTIDFDPGALVAALHVADRVRRRAERVKAEPPYPRLIVVGDSWLFILHPGALPRVVDSAEASHLLQLGVV